MAKKKFYVIWKGHKTGVFTSWNVCKKHIVDFKGAQYKSFISKDEAEKAIKGKYEDYVGKDTKKIKLSKEELEKIGKPIYPSLSVDAACSGNPGKMEYRGVDSQSKKQLFIQGPFEKGTNNIGEFLALVHGLGYLKNKNSNLPIYSDSRIAISWVKKGQCRTNLPITQENKQLFDFVKRAENWLKNNIYSTKILKWETKAWGEIPADFGRK
ncbi:ribonuclease H1 domain-containing protein [Urechidicola croceus]|uniref:Ribonuclease H n=1 Tax=Urechidicola croceus TaxID=1850246 RepID=A0A1D8P9R3_9FLAO|nr:ribonuclease H family protein [Urechidicola croceus]AOW21339.1 ribonuclease H [Urechidicola croceus]